MSHGGANTNPASIDALLADPAASFHIPRADHSSPTNHPPSCCCGKADCAFLAHSAAAFADLERDVRAAAQVGQALLSRHESYVADAERERTRAAAALTALEREASRLEAENTRLTSENRSLLEQVERLNASVDDADARAQGLEATLQSAQQELLKLSSLAARAESLELQVLQLEAEQAQLQTRLSDSADEQAATAQRWRDAQRRAAELEAQLEQVEREAHAERQRHSEVVAQMEKRRAVERELQASSDRLKKAAAAGADEAAEHGRHSEVVSKFVKEILQDNANLQLSMVELQDLLSSANDEVESLRQQLVDEPPDDLDAAEPSRAVSLGAELDRQQQQRQQEMHIHHHYHAPRASKPPARPALKKKRPAMLPSGRTTPAGVSSKRSSASSAISPLNTHRWSGFSAASFTLSTSPSSPSFSAAPSTIFELPPPPLNRYDDFSRPTTPDSPRPASPAAKPGASSFDADADLAPAPPLRRAPSQTSLLTASLSGMDLHTTLVPGSPASTTSRRGTARPALHPTSSNASAAAAALSAATASSALGRNDGLRRVSGALRDTLGERKTGKVEKERYAPLTDTFGGFGRWWGRGRKGKAEEMVRVVEEEGEGEARVEMVDEEGLRECLAEEVEG